MYLATMKDHALRIAGARAKYGDDDARTLYEIALARAAIRSHLEWATKVQREWQASASPNPLRNRFHDSWEAREDYVRANATFDRRIATDYAERVRIAAGYPKWWHRVTNCGSGITGNPCARCVR